MEPLNYTGVKECGVCNLLPIGQKGQKMTHKTLKIHLNNLSNKYENLCTSHMTFLPSLKLYQS